MKNKTSKTLGMPKKINTNYDKNGYKLLKKESISELDYPYSKLKNHKHTAWEYIHKSGCRVLFLQNDDPEMSFCIGFKTLPKDSTGVFHILEHSVLCGSKKFPVKEPFTNLLKSSMQTFLNAMTFPDKTIYPVSSTNEKDLFNLIDVYMDAVLFPNIYKNKNIFYQEGGHKTAVNIKNNWYEGFNGVVYNEMKGVYSEPTEHLFENLTKGLFPNSCYAYSSGGDPISIKKLSYNEFLNQHKQNYKLNNAYIIIYGNASKNKIFKFLNDNYLSKEKEINKWRSTKDKSKIKTGKFPTKHNNKIVFKTTEVKTSKENTCCGIAFATQKNRKKTIALKILIDAIASSNESPLKKSLLSLNLAKDITFETVNELKYPFVLVQAKNIKKGACKKLYNSLIEKTKELTNTKIPKKLIDAAISNFEYKIYERDPECSAGIDFSIDILSDWLYNKNKSTDSIKYKQLLSWLKNMSKTDYFNKLAIEIFIDNMWVAQSEVLATNNKTKSKQKKITKKESENIITKCKKISEWQTTPDSPDDESKIPTMSKSDIGEINNYPKWIKENTKIPAIRYELNTNGIIYTNRYYSLNNLTKGELPYVNILCHLLGKLDTLKHSSEDIDTITQDKIGSLNFYTNYFENWKDNKKIKLNLTISASCLKTNNEYLLWFVDEIIYDTQFNNTSKIEIILHQLKTSLEQSFISSGHIHSINRSLSNILPANKAKDIISGIEFYNFLKTQLKDFNKNSEILIRKLKKVSEKIFYTKPTISFMGEKKYFKSYINNFDKNKAKYVVKNKNWRFKLNKDNEAFIIPSNVNYCSLTNDIRNYKNLTNIKFNVASKIIALEYLWNEVRIKNGAYGAGLIVNDIGTMQYYSFRDPNIIKTFENYFKSCNWLKNLELDNQKLDNFIISCVAKIDAPVTCKFIMQYQDCKYFCGIANNKREILRKSIIKTSQKDIKEAAIILEKLCKHGNKCVFGGELIKELDKNEYKIIDLFAN